MAIETLEQQQDETRRLVHAYLAGTATEGEVLDGLTGFDWEMGEEGYETLARLVELAFEHRECEALRAELAAIAAMPNFPPEWDAPGG